jgi:hypothetical protein
LNEHRITCTGFCTDCEQKKLLREGERLERMSHGADSSDFRVIIDKQYDNNTPVMFLMLDPAPNHLDSRDESVAFNQISKDIPTKGYYWITDYVTEPVTEEVIKESSFYDLYWWYLQEKHSLNNIYITNLLKCYSKDNNNNVLVNCVEKFLLKEIELFKPEIIFCMGSKTHYVLKRNPCIKSKLGGIKVERLYHPAWVDSYRRNKAEYLKHNDDIIEKSLN